MYNELICILQISYGLTDDRFNSHNLFYRTLPSVKSLNQARIKLLVNFDWLRIGILSSSQIQYRYVSLHDLYSYFQHEVKVIRYKFVYLITCVSSIIVPLLAKCIQVLKSGLEDTTLLLGPGTLCSV